jgi:hypothetical protein
VRARLLTALLLVLAPFALRAGAEQPVRIVILPVVVHRAAPDSSFVSSGIADMLSARLEQIGDIEVVRIERLDAATTELENAREVARSVGGDYVLYGAFTQFGEGASLDVKCAALDPNNPHGNGARRVFIQSGEIGEIIPQLDVLVGKLVGYLREGGEISEASALAAVASPVGETPDGAGAASSDDIQELRERIEALEQAVYEAELGESPSDAATTAPQGVEESSPVATSEGVEEGSAAATPDVVEEGSAAATTGIVKEDAPES